MYPWLVSSYMFIIELLTHFVYFIYNCSLYTLYDCFVNKDFEKEKKKSCGTFRHFLF